MRLQAAASTPYRRSQVELLEQLNSLFDSLPSGSRPTSPLLSLPDGFEQNQPRTAPMRLLPELFAAFEQKRGIVLLSAEEKAWMAQLVEGLPEEMRDSPVGVEQVLGLLVQMGVAGNSSSSSSSSEVDEPPKAGLSPSFTRRPSLRGDPLSYTTPTGSPIARHRRTASNSSLTSLSGPSSPSSTTGGGIPSLTFPPSTTVQAPSPASASTTPLRRRSLLSSLSRSSPSASSSSSKGLRKRRTFEDLSALVVQQGGTYLGVPLDGPTGEGTGEGEWDLGGVVEKARGIVGAKALNRDRDLSTLLSPLTFPQLKALDSAYAKSSGAQGASAGGGKSLLEVVTGEKAFKGNVEYALRGLLMGPLGWDVWLLQKALEGATTNDTLLIDLLISRTPSDLALLRAAYSSRSSLRSASSADASPATSSPASKNLDVAVLSAFSSNIRLRKAWEVALQGRWEDAPEGEDQESGVTELQREEREERRRKLLREDLDQLKVALRRGGNIEIVAKILLARSPTHLHSLTLDYRKTVTAGHSSLTKAIKQCIPAGTLQRLFLHAVENAKNVTTAAGEGKEGGFGTGVWRDAKALERAVEVEKGGKRDELLWRLVRLHWDRPRFLAIQQAFKQKYRKPLTDRLASALPAGVLVDLTTALAKSAALPDPNPSEKDQQRLSQAPKRPTAESVAMRSRTSSASSLASMPEQEEGASSSAAPSSSHGGADSEAESVGSESSSPGGGRVESSELEAEGELSDPPSPRSPPGQSEFEFEIEMDEAGEQGADALEEEMQEQATPMLPSFARAETPTVPHSSAPPECGPRSASADRSSGEKGHVKSSSLSFRQRSAPLELVGHRPPSSAGGSNDSAKLSSSLRHSRPIAPSRAKRRQSDNPDRSRGERDESEEPLSPSARGRGFVSPTPSTPSQSRASLSRSTSSSNGESLGSSVGSAHSAAIEMGNASMASSSATADDSFFGSPPTSIDTTSFHAAPLSPHQPSDRSSSSFFPGQTPPPASPPAFDLSAAASDFFSVGTNTPDSSPEKHFSSFLRRQGSTVSHFSTTSSTGPGSGGSRPSSLFAGEGGLGLPVSIFEGSPAGHSRDGSNGTLGGGEQVQQLLRHANELARKLKEAETRFQANATAYEEQVSDLEGRLEEARSELQAKRKEEKDLRSVEKEHLVQINSLEADVAKLTKSLERSRESYDAMKRNYTATCEEAERLRALVAETRRENRAAEEAIQNHALQVQQFERDRDLLQQTINRLEEDLGVARRAQDSLDDQKQENLLLKETIDKLRFEIDEMRANARKSQFLDGPLAPGSPAKSLAESLSKSLGREIANQMASQDDDSESSDEGEDTAGEDEVDDIIVTTHRRIKKRSKKSSPASAEPVVTHVQTSVNVCDADIQTDLTETHEMDVQTDLSAVNLELIAAPAAKPEVVVVEPLPPIKPPQELQADLAKELGVDFDLVKQFVDASKTGKAQKLIADAVSPPLASPRRSGRWRQRIPMAHAPSVLVNAFPNSARPYVAQVLDSSISLVLYSASLYLLGVVTGSRFLPVNHHHTFAPFQVMFNSQDSTAYNTLNWEGLAPGNGGSGYASEGLSNMLIELIWSGVRTARRIPV
ncbi:hypothetical protein JCM6882_005685 [Rhodosporidiobolus microsporus]